LEDADIVELYFSRQEAAIAQTDMKYGKMLKSICNGILNSPEDAEECLNDTLLSLWNSIPPKRPEKLGAYAAKIARNSALNRLEKSNAIKRSGELLIYEELSEFLPDDEDGSNWADAETLKNEINLFLRSLKPLQRVIFVKRYFFCDSIRQISESTGLKENAVKTTLFRLRESFRKKLIKAGLL